MRFLTIAVIGVLGARAVLAGDADTLTTGVPTAGSLATGDVHRYLVPLKAGDYARIELDQEGIDVGLSLVAPGRASLAELVHRSGESRAVCAIARSAGSYELRIRALETEPREGRYVVVLSEKRPAVPADARRVKATQLLLEAGRLWSEGESAGSATRALGVYQAAFDLLSAVPDRSGQALAARRLGHAHHAMGAPEAALRPLRQSLALSQAAVDVRAECAALTALASAEVDVGSLDEAMLHAQRALETGRRSGNRRCEAEALNVTGDIHSFRGRTLDAPALYEQALAISRELRDRRVEAQALLNRGYALADLSQLTEAQTAYEAALVHWRSVAERRGEARTLIGLAQLHGIAGEKREALRYYQQARELVERLADRWGQAVIESGMGAAYLQLGEPEAAIGPYRTAVELFRAAKVAYGEAANLLHLGASLAAAGRHVEALGEERRALAIARSLSDSRLEARALQSIGQTQADTGRLDEALASQEQALSLARAIGFVRAETDAQNGMGELLLRQGRYDDASRCFSEASGLAQLGKDRYAESRALFGLSRIEASGGRLDDALAKLQGSLDLVEDLRADVASLDLRASYIASIRERHEMEIDLLTRLHERDAARGYDARAFEAADRARARSLLDGLAEARAQIHEGVDPTLRERETSLGQQLNAKAARLMRMPRNERDKASVLEKEVDDLTLAHREIRARIRAESPRYAALTAPRRLRLSEVQETVVDQQSVLLQYFLGARRSYVWAVTPTAIASHALPGREEIEALVLPYRDALVGPGASASHRPGGSPATGPDPHTAIAVSRALLGPVADQLGASRVVVVSDGVLESVPFAALPDPRRTPPEGEMIVPLVQEHEVVHLPSASTLALIRDAQPTGKRWVKEVLVFADPVFEADDPRLADAPRHGKVARSSGPPRPSARPARPAARTLRDAFGPGPPALPRLIGSGHEARRIAALTTEADLLLGFQASRTSAVDPRVKDHRIVHFATHAIVDNDRPELSGIVLSLFDEQGEARDGFVRLHDVYNMKLPVDLVVLSGCSSALGKPVAGEGLISLVRGFMYAGARQVLASLWKVDDEATAELMARFYRGMWKNGLTPSASLRAAQLELMGERRWRHPFYWAAFVLSGDWDLEYIRSARTGIPDGTDTPFRAARGATPAAGTRPRAGGAALRAAAPRPDHRLRVPALRRPGGAGGRDAGPSRRKAARDGDRLRRERPGVIRVRRGLERGPRVVPAAHPGASPRGMGGARRGGDRSRGRRAEAALSRAVPGNAGRRRTEPGGRLLPRREERQDPAPLGPGARAGSEPECLAAQDPPHHPGLARLRLSLRGHGRTLSRDGSLNGRRTDRVTRPCA